MNFIDVTESNNKKVTLGRSFRPWPLTTPLLCSATGMEDMVFESSGTAVFPLTSPRMSLARLPLELDAKKKIRGVHSTLMPTSLS